LSGGLVAQLRIQLNQRADFSEVLAGTWGALPPADLARRQVYLEGDGAVPLGEIFDIAGLPEGRIRFVGNLELVDRLAAGLSEGEVIVEGNVGRGAGLALAGGALDIHGNAGPDAGAALAGFRRGMTGGEIIVRGSAAAGAGAYMRRGLIVIAGRAGNHTGLGMIAGTVVVVGATGSDSGLWSKRGTVVALGRIVPPLTYSYACTYQPVHLRLLFTRLRTRYGLSIRPRHLNGYYRRYSGDMAELGKGEILAWTAK
jgi:formylmethanofuran dehydrogenase subunit C